METLKRTVVQLYPLALPLRQRREMEHGPTLWALVCFISMLIMSGTFSPLASTLNVASNTSVFCLSVCVSNGRAVHYNGSSLLQWKSVRLDVALLPGTTSSSYTCLKNIVK